VVEQDSNVQAVCMVKMEKHTKRRSRYEERFILLPIPTMTGTPLFSNKAWNKDK